MMFTIPSFNYINRLLIIITGITLLFWSGLEDNQVTTVVILGWVLAGFTTFSLIQSRFGGQSIQPNTLVKLAPIIGATIGALASLITALLMLFKDVRHGHIFPDYPPQLMIAILERLPIWAISGALVLFGVILLSYVIYGDKSSSDSATI